MLEVDRLELARLILEGQNVSFEELRVWKQDLSFHLLEEKLREKLGIAACTQDVLKTLELYSDREGYNHAAELFADTNEFCGVDMVRFGDSISILPDRETHAHVSLLRQHDAALTMFRKYYQYEEIRGSFGGALVMIKNFELRAGKQHCQSGTVEFLQRTIALCRQLTDKPLLIRLDSGNDSIDNVAVLMENNCFFIIKIIGGLTDRGEACIMAKNVKGDIC